MKNNVEFHGSNLSKTLQVKFIGFLRNPKSETPLHQSMNKKHEKRSIAKWFAPLIVKLLQCLEVSFRGDHPLLVVSTRLSQAYSLVCTDVCPKTKEWETTKINKYKNAHPNCTLHAHICVCTNCLYVYIYIVIYINVQYYTHIEETNVIIDI